MADVTPIIGRPSTPVEAPATLEGAISGILVAATPQLPAQPGGPEPGHRNAIECPQCDQWAWRASAHCWNCGLSIAEYFQGLEQLRLNREKDALARRRLVIALLCFTCGAILMAASSWAPGPWGMRLVVLAIAAWAVSWAAIQSI